MNKKLIDKHWTVACEIEAQWPQADIIFGIDILTVFLDGVKFDLAKGWHPSTEKDVWRFATGVPVRDSPFANSPIELINNYIETQINHWKNFGKPTVSGF